MVYARKIHHLIYLGLILALAFFLKLPSLFEPNHYGDEGIYQVIGQVMRRGALLYRDIWDNKPPFLYLLYSLFDGDQFSVRLFSLIVALLTVVAFYFLAQELFLKRSKITLFTTILFAVLFSLPLLEGNIANAENFMFFPVILAFYLALKNFPKIKASLLFLAGFLFSLAFLFKIVAIFDLAALSLFLLIAFWGQRRQQASSLIALSFGFILPLIFATLIFLTQGTFKEFLSAALSQNVSYVAWGNKFLGAWGGLILKLALLGFFCLFLLWQRKKLEKGPLLILSWWAFSLFNALFAGRPWTHYVLILVPSFCLLFGLALQTAKFRVFTIGLLLFTLYLGGTKFWLYEQIFGYYPNFFSFILGKKTLSAYRSFWGDHVNRDYRLAQFLTLKTATDEPVFIWGNNAQIYALAKRPPASRYTVAYHMSFTPQAEKETLQSLVKNKPKYFIILLPPAEPLRTLGAILARNYHLAFEEEGFKVYERRL